MGFIHLAYAICHVGDIMYVYKLYVRGGFDLKVGGGNKMANLVVIHTRHEGDVQRKVGDVNQKLEQKWNESTRAFQLVRLLLDIYSQPGKQQSGCILYCHAFLCR